MPPRIEEEFWLDTTDVDHFEMLGSAGIMQFSRLNDFLVELLAFKGEEEVVSLEFEALLTGEHVLSGMLLGFKVLHRVV